MLIRPQDGAVDTGGHVQGVMMVVPVDGEKREAQHVHQELGPQGLERRPARAVRRVQLEHHDGDDDRDHTVTEGFEPPLGHRPSFSTPSKNSTTPLSSENSAPTTRKPSVSISCSSTSEPCRKWLTEIATLWRTAWRTNAS